VCLTQRDSHDQHNWHVDNFHVSLTTTSQSLNYIESVFIINDIMCTSYGIEFDAYCILIMEAATTA